MMHVEKVKLATGAEIPLIGLGTWRLTGEEIIEAVKVALDIGYRFIDTSYAYGNEADIGKALKEYFATGKLKREDVFVSTKLPPFAHAPDEVQLAFDAQLKDLQLDYVDLYLIHCPMPYKHQAGDKHGKYHAVIENGEMVPDLIELADTWKAMEKIYKSGKAKAIGLSNFNEEQIQNILDHATVKPHNLQVEAHIYWPQNELFELCRKNNITFTAYCPLGSPGRQTAFPDAYWPEGEPMEDPVTLELAKKHNRSPAQILLRYLVQRGMIAIPKTADPGQLRENLNVFDFNLTDDDLSRINGIKKHTRLAVFQYAVNHPWYPFKDVDRSKYKAFAIKEL